MGVYNKTMTMRFTPMCTLIPITLINAAYYRAFVIITNAYLVGSLSTLALARAHTGTSTLNARQVGINASHIHSAHSKRARW